MSCVVIDGGVMSRKNGKKAVVFKGSAVECAVEKYRRNMIEGIKDAYVIPVREGKPKAEGVFYLLDRKAGIIYRTVEGKRIAERVPPVYLVWNGAEILGRYNDVKSIKKAHPKAQFLSREWRSMWLQWSEWRQGK